MSLLRHWLATPDFGSTPLRVLVNETDVARHREDGWTVEGPFVPESQGAVEENQRLRAALEFYAEEDSEFDAGGVDGGRRALEALGLPFGGQ